MKTRCYNEDTPFYHRYGGRGIKVCERWLNSFENFFADMGRRPSAEYSLDRWPNSDGDYEPDNCRWATKDQQASNRSTVKFIQYCGVIDSIAGWSRRAGIPYMRLRRRIVDGWSVERALEIGPRAAKLFKQEAS